MQTDIKWDIIEKFLSEIGASFKTPPHFHRKSKKLFVFISIRPAWGKFNIIHLFYIVVLKELHKKFNCIPVIIFFDWKLKIDSDNLSDGTLSAWTKNYRKTVNKIIGKCIIKNESDFKGTSFDCLKLIKDLDPPIYNGYYRGLEIFILYYNKHVFCHINDSISRIY